MIEFSEEESNMTRRAIRVMAILLVLVGLSAPVTVSALEVGDKAPDFELPSSQGGKLKLSSFQGKKNVLIQFYVLDFTPT
jgi:AhpC/TSA family protein